MIPIRKVILASVLAIVPAVFYISQLLALESTPPIGRDFFDSSPVYEFLETEALPEAGTVPETKVKTPPEVQIEPQDFSIQ